ncbi:MAG: Zn-dependent hydrolase [Alphaproteobacteria bacterium CG_4_10_14_0_2_um_filter_63_37]|nr:MAG: Zn-dependent hydrolase [Alphaproteobacteria bacterium CG_4_10_14_0_2_um_filter_63_37]
MVFRQLFDDATSTYSYILGDPITREAVIIDPVLEQVKRDLAVLEEESLDLILILDTHIHADHVTGADALRRKTGADYGVGAFEGASGSDMTVEDGDAIPFGFEVIRAIATPGHTSGCMTYHWRNCLFTGDALLIGKCGRTDFQSGDAGTLFDSITKKLFELPDEVLIYPGHDYAGRRVSCIGQEKAINERIGGGVDREGFIASMGGLNLPYPKQMDRAVPANLRGGIER